MSHLGTATAKVVGLGLLMSMSWQLKNEYTSGGVLLHCLLKSQWAIRFPTLVQINVPYVDIVFG